MSTVHTSARTAEYDSAVYVCVLTLVERLLCQTGVCVCVAGPLCGRSRVSERGFALAHCGAKTTVHMATIMRKRAKTTEFQTLI